MKHLFTLLIIFGSFSALARPSKCKVKARIKIEKQGNKGYNRCLDDFLEDGEDYFFTNRPFKFYNINRLECVEDVPRQIIGQKVEVQFLSSLNTGFLMLGEPIYDTCVGTVVSIEKIKYKSAK